MNFRVRSTQRVKKPPARMKRRGGTGRARVVGSWGKM